MKLSCPQCGAEIDLQPRSLQLICPFCSTKLKFSKEPFLERYRMEPTIEEEPATAISQQVLRDKNRTEAIVKKTLLYLPFYRFLCEKKEGFSEQVFSALEASSFPLFTIPSGTLTPVEENEELQGPKPQKSLSKILQTASLEKTKSIEEMLLLFLPFWKITLSNGDVIWIDAVEGRVVASDIEKGRQRMPKFYSKVLFSSLLVVLFIEGIFLPSFPVRLLLQIITAAVAFVIAQKVVKDDD